MCPNAGHVLSREQEAYVIWTSRPYWLLILWPLYSMACSLLISNPLVHDGEGAGMLEGASKVSIIPPRCKCTARSRYERTPELRSGCSSRAAMVSQKP